MGHSIAAFIVPASVVETLRRKRFTHLHLVRLDQEFYLIPITDPFFEEVESRYPVEGERHDEFWMLSHSLAELASDVSHGAEVAYVETDYFGGTGTQAAMVWKDDVIALQPRKSKWGVINEALRMIGVRRGSNGDEFDTIGLGQFRTEHDCLEAAEPAPQDTSSQNAEEKGDGSTSQRLINAVRRFLRQR